VVVGDPHQLPPTLNAAHVFHRRGWQVDLLGIRWSGRTSTADDYPEGVRFRIHREARLGLAFNLDYAAFAGWACGLARRERYPWVYAYDLHAAPLGAAMALLAGGRWIYHNHDLSVPEEMSRSQRWLGLKRMEVAAAKRAAAVVFPQAGRARIFATQARLARPPLVAFNCPPLEWPTVADPPAPQLMSFRSRFPRLVIYQGGLNLDRGLGALVESMPHWPSDAALVLVGDPRLSRDVPEIRRRIGELGVGERVLWLGAIPYRALPRVTRLGSLGVLLTPPGRGSNINLEQFAGASNKVFEYMACGLPVLVPESPGFFELIEQPGFGEICRGYQAIVLGRQIARLLDDEAARAEMSRRALEAFRSTYHYERQLEPVLALVEGSTA
jgi:glycosyltransferase involved in cell wall biosynthesis